jgi:6-phosphofructokinase 1
LGQGQFGLQEKFYRSFSELQSSFKFKIAGASDNIYCDPAKTKVAIATCGGLVPGMNVAIRSLVKCLEQQYGVTQIYGIKYGFYGLHENKEEHWVNLDAKYVRNIQTKGGTILGMSGCDFDADKALKNLQARGITQLYVIGGIGTHMALAELQQKVHAAKAKISLVSIPTSIDNHVPVIDRSFGFATAIQESIQFIDSANVEAGAAENCVGIVRMMGRNSGFIAVTAALASRDVNIVVVPEIHF